MYIRHKKYKQHCKSCSFTLIGISLQLTSRLSALLTRSGCTHIMLPESIISGAKLLPYWPSQVKLSDLVISTLGTLIPASMVTIIHDRVIEIGGTSCLSLLSSSLYAGRLHQRPSMLRSYPCGYSNLLWDNLIFDETNNIQGQQFDPLLQDVWAWAALAYCPS